MSKLLVFTSLVILFSLCFVVRGQEMPAAFLTAAKSVPRIGRSSNPKMGYQQFKKEEDFDNFFLKASKSVPRIGRRNENPFVDHEGSDKDLQETNKLKYPTWSEIAERYEYEPEVFSPQYLARYEELLGDDPSIYDWEKVRMKRTTPIQIVPHPKYVYQV